MLLIGKHITTPGELLQPVEVEKVFKAIRNEKGEVAILQKRLKAIQMIDIAQYRKLKTGLPYLVCAHFHPKVRKKENFVFTERFIVDIDHLSDYELDLQQIKEKLSADSRVELLFTSPGGDGLKVLFVLSEKISDSGYYAMFYKSFCIRLAEQYQLRGAVDIKTNDVSRCCFVSFDPDAYFNSNAEKIIATQYLPEEGAIDFEALKSEIKQKEQELTDEKKELGIKPVGPAPLTDDILLKIKEKVGMRVKKPVQKTYIQPEELDTIIPLVSKQLEEIGADILKITSIDYGRQIRVGADSHWAEVNLFYGKKGVSVVGTTKSGSSKSLCDSVVLLLKDYFTVT